MRRTETWTTYNETQKMELEALCRNYREFLDTGKTERECVKETIRLAEEAGYVNLEEVRKSGRKLQPGDCVYAVGMKKIIALFCIGEAPLEDGMRILGAHIDSPRLDVKQNPLYEDTGFAYLDTHYYGGIKKYQWVTIPLALHGVVALKDGTVQEICIGEEESDPVLFISDLLIHLAAEQMDKKARVVIEGEGLDVVVGSNPVFKKDEDNAEQAAGQDADSLSKDCKEEKDSSEKKEKEAVKKHVLQILKEKYGIEEEDFLSAEIEVVPAGKARDCGLDSSMIMAYGQDDRVCAYTSLVAQLQTGMQARTGCTLLVDKEEIGSVGATGMQSRFFENTVAELMDLTGDYSELKLRRCLANSCMLSSDVSAAFDPMFAGSFEKKNAAYFGKGLVLNKFTGARGKSGSNDANAEYIAHVRAVFDEADVAFQTAELGKVDLGGGGTIAYISALYGMQVIDSGVAVLNMHAPMEVTSKADVYEAVCGYRAFLEKA